MENSTTSNMSQWTGAEAKETEGKGWMARAKEWICSLVCPPHLPPVPGIDEQPQPTESEATPENGIKTRVKDWFCSFTSSDPAKVLAVAKGFVANAKKWTDQSVIAMKDAMNSSWPTIKNFFIRVTEWFSARTKSSDPAKVVTAVAKGFVANAKKWADQSVRVVKDAMISTWSKMKNAFQHVKTWIVKGVAIFVRIKAEESHQGIKTWITVDLARKIRHNKKLIRSWKVSIAATFYEWKAKVLEIILRHFWNKYVIHIGKTLSTFITWLSLKVTTGLAMMVALGAICVETLELFIRDTFNKVEDPVCHQDPQIGSSFSISTLDDSNNDPITSLPSAPPTNANPSAGRPTCVRPRSNKGAILAAHGASRLSRRQQDKTRPPRPQEVRRRRPYRPSSARLSLEDEGKARRIMKELFSCLCDLLATALREYLLDRGLTRDSSCTDAYDYLKVVKRNIQALPEFAGQRRLVKQAGDGRNAVAHLDLPRVLNHWKSYLEAWAEVASLIGEQEITTQILALRDRLEEEEGGQAAVSNNGASAWIASFFAASSDPAKGANEEKGFVAKAKEWADQSVTAMKGAIISTWSRMKNVFLHARTWIVEEVPSFVKYKAREFGRDVKTWITVDFAKETRSYDEMFNDLNVYAPVNFYEWKDKLARNLWYFRSNYAILIGQTVAITVTWFSWKLTIAMAVPFAIGSLLWMVDKNCGPWIKFGGQNGGQPFSIGPCSQLIAIGMISLPIWIRLGLLKMGAIGMTVGAILVLLHASFIKVKDPAVEKKDE